MISQEFCDPEIFNRHMSFVYMPCDRYSKSLSVLCELALAFSIYRSYIFGGASLHVAYDAADGTACAAAVLFRRKRPFQESVYINIK